MPDLKPSQRKPILLDTFRVCLLFLPIGLGAILFGGVRPWSVGLLIAFSSLGLLGLGGRGQLPFLLRLFLLAILLYGFGYLWVAKPHWEARYEWLKLLHALMLLYGWLRLSRRYETLWLKLCALVMLVAVLLSSYALFQHVQGTRMVLHLQRSEIYGMRVSGTFMCPNHFAALLAMTLPVALLAVFSVGRSIGLRLLGLTALTTCLPALLLTGSRAGYAGALAGVLVTVALLALKRGVMRFVGVMCLLALVLSSISVAVYTRMPDVRERIDQMDPRHLEGSASDRLRYWEGAIEGIKAEPLWGHGPGSFRWVYPHYKTFSADTLLRYAHNEILHSAFEYGLIGLLLFGLTATSLFVYVLVAYVRAPSRGVSALHAASLGIAAAAFVHGLFDFNLHVFSIAHVPVLYLGLSLGRQAREKRSRRPSSYKCLHGVMVLVLAGAGMHVTAIDVLKRRGRFLEDRFESDHAAGYYRLALKGDPRYWPAHQSLGELYEVRAFWERDLAIKTRYAEVARGSYRRVRAENPHHIRSRLGIAKTSLLLGEIEGGLQALRALSAALPKEIRYHKELGLALRRYDYDVEALEVFGRAALIDATDPVVAANLRALRRKKKG